MAGSGASGDPSRGFLADSSGRPANWSDDRREMRRLCVAGVEDMNGKISWVRAGGKRPSVNETLEPKNKGGKAKDTYLCVKTFYTPQMPGACTLQTPSYASRRCAIPRTFNQKKPSIYEESATATRAQTFLSRRCSESDLPCLMFESAPVRWSQW